MNEVVTGLDGYRRKVSAEKRARILKTAAAEFSKHGFHGAAMVKIARKAPVSTATLYKHFDSKRDLFLSVAEHLEIEQGQLAVNILVTKAVVNALPKLRKGADDCVRSAFTMLDGLIETMETALEEEASNEMGEAA